MKRHTSRAASHSESSNAFLSAACISGAFGFAGIFAFLALKGLLPDSAFALGAVVSGAVCAVSAAILMFFRR